MGRSGGISGGRFLGVAALTAMVGAVLVPANVADAASGCLLLGSAASYSEYVTGGSTVSSENVAGSVAYGGASTISQSNLATTSVSASTITMVLGSPSTMTTTSLQHGNGVFVAPLTGGANSGTFSAVLQSALPFQFSAAQSSLAAASTTIATLTTTNAATGTSTLSLNTAGTGTDVFSITEGQLHSAVTVAISAPASAVVVINVTGSSALSLSAQTVTLSGGVTAPDVLWNLPSVPSITLSAENWSGTLLQPSGTLTASANSVTGSLLAGTTSASLSANNVNLGLFAGCILSGPPPGAPEAPLGILLPMAAAAVVGGAVWVGRRKRFRSAGS